MGFGIKDAETAASMSQVADAVVVGSAIVKQIEANPDQSDVIMNNIGNLLADMRAAMDK